MPEEKEPFFFSHNFRRGMDWYHEVFAGAGNQSRIGEASTTYFASQDAPDRIHKTIPAAKLVFVLRNPIERAWSEYRYSKTVGAIPPGKSFRRFAMETNRVVAWSRYMDFLPAWENLFPEDQRLIIILDDLKSDSASTVRRVYEFLGIDSGFEPPTEERYNVTPNPRSVGLYVFLQRHWLNLHRRFRGTPMQRVLESGKSLGRRIASPVLMRASPGENLSPEDEQWLRDQFSESNRLLAEHLDRDLNTWG